MTTEEFLKGPDQLLPGATELTTSEPEGTVLLRDPSSLSSVPPLSVPSLLRQASENSPDVVALGVKRDDKWIKWSYKQYYQDSRTIAKAFIKLGLQRY